MKHLRALRNLNRLQQSRQTAFIWGAVLVPVCKLEDELSQLRGRHSKELSTGPCYNHFHL